MYERLQPILEACGDNVRCAGSLGAGSVCTLVHNLIGHGSRQDIAPAAELGREDTVPLPRAHLVEELHRESSFGADARGYLTVTLEPAIVRQRFQELLAGP